MTKYYFHYNKSSNSSSIKVKTNGISSVTKFMYKKGGCILSWSLLDDDRRSLRSIHKKCIILIYRYWEAIMTQGKHNCQ